MAPDNLDVAVAIGPQPPRPAFPNYTELPVRVPLRVWRIGRIVTLAAALGLCILLVARPVTGLELLWRVLVPLLPILWLTMPGLWRNLCPLAASNQVPRAYGFTRARKPPAAMARFSYVFAMTAFLALVPARKVIFNRNGLASAVLLLVVLGLAFAGGVAFKGKSGWCSTICPLLPVQRLYGETPFLLVRNSHCEPCVGCAKNCFDFNPRAAKLADLADDDPRYAAPRRFFAAAFPGLVAGFFSMPYLPAQSTLWIYGRIALFVAVSVGVFSLVESFTPISAHQLTALFAAAAFDLFYWYSVPTLIDAIGGSPGGTVRSVAVWTGRVAVAAVTVPWLIRTFAKEAQFAAATTAAPAVAPAVLRTLPADSKVEPSVTFRPDGPQVVVAAGTTLLEVIERAGLAIESGCRLGVCGADPVTILDGAPALSPVTVDEGTTLQRLGLAPNSRLACTARVHGACSVSLATAPAPAGSRLPSTRGGTARGSAVRRVVVIGNGIAGSTAADHLRRLHPDCEIDLVATEAHRLYNRMAISRLIYGRSAMHGLYLLPDGWHEDNGIKCWLNTRARAVDAAERRVVLASGESLDYDRLILATGSRSAVPHVPGIDRRGSFTLRVAEDAIAIRAYAQEHSIGAAVVAGGGVLGVESAYALHMFGIATTVLERGPWLMRRQLDETAARILERYLQALGIAVAVNTSVTAVGGTPNVEHVTLADGQKLDCGLFLSCAGSVPNVELARDAGLAAHRGVVVDARMRTSNPFVYAAGDVAEFDGRIEGLWPQSFRQGVIAATNAVGGDVEYAAILPTTLLKVVGVDVASIGVIDRVAPDDVVVTIEDDDGTRYRRLVVHDGRAVGAILVGHAHELPSVQRAVEEHADVSGLLDQLRAGDWSALRPDE